MYGPRPPLPVLPQKHYLQTKSRTSTIQKFVNSSGLPGDFDQYSIGHCTFFLKSRTVNEFDKQTEKWNVPQLYRGRRMGIFGSHPRYS